MIAHTPDRTRDPQRSRNAILAAAESLFAEHGYEGTSLAEIAAHAGLSRGTPSYFFGAKEQLYLEVLDRAFIARQAATEAAFAPVHAWCAGGQGLAELRVALGAAAGDYLRFLAQKPSSVRLVVQEELGGGHWLRRRGTPSTALEDAFTALRRAGADRGVSTFEVNDAVLLFIALTFAPVSYRNTLMRAVDRDLERPAGRRAQVELVVEHLMHLITA